MRKGLIVGMGAVAVLALAGCKVETFWSPDGKSIAYLAEGELRLYDVAAKESKRLDTGAGRVVSAAWSPDGKRIAFYGATLGEEADVSLRVVEPASGKVTTLVRKVWPLLKEAPRDDDAEGGSPQEALRAAQEDDLNTFGYLASLAWSPDGKHLAYVGASQSLAGVFVLKVPAESTAAVPGTGAEQIAPAWSPDGKWLAYVAAPFAPAPSAETEGGGSSSAAGKDALWLYDPAAAQSVKVCDMPGDGLAMGTRLQWSRDSRRLGFIAMGGEAATGCLVEARAGAEVSRALPGVTAMADWAPGLGAVAYVGQSMDQEAVPLLYRAVGSAEPSTLGTLEAGAGGPPPLPTMGEMAAVPFTMPQFSPDGKQVALTVGEGSAVQVQVFADR